MADNKPADDKQYFFDKPRNVKLILYGLYASCAILLLLDFIVHRHILHKWETLLGFYSIYGFIACTSIVLGSKFFRTIVQRSENYYEGDEAPDGSGDGHVDK